jgi:glycosyltransferase involved in cell wall biosynthesis
VRVLFIDSGPAAPRSSALAELRAAGVTVTEPRGSSRVAALRAIMRDPVDLIHLRRADSLVASVALALRPSRRVVLEIEGARTGALGRRLLSRAGAVVVDSSDQAERLFDVHRLRRLPVVLAREGQRGAGTVQLYARLVAGAALPPRQSELPAGRRVVTDRALRRLGSVRPRRVARVAYVASARTPALRAAAGMLALGLGDEHSARGDAAAVLERDPRDQRANRVQARLLDHAGEPSRALRTALAGSDVAMAKRIRAQLGVLTGERPDWGAPAALGGYTPTRPVFARPPSRRRTRVLNLLETSLPHAPAGYAHRSALLIRAQAGAGFEPTVVTRLGFPAARGTRRFAPLELVEGVPHHRLWLESVSHYTEIPIDMQLEWYVDAVEELVRRLRSDLIWAASPYLNGIAALEVGKRCDLPVVYDVRGFPEMSWSAAHPDRPDAELPRLRRDAETRCMLGARAVVTLGGVMRDSIIARGVPATRVHVLPHAADDRFFAADRRASPSSSDRLTVGLAATLRRYEGADELLRAVALARADGVELTCTVLGSGPHEAALRTLGADLGLTDSVHFTGRVSQDQVLRAMAGLDLFVTPRQNLEVCRFVTPLKLIEPMAAGVPVLASDLPALSEIAGGGRGKLVEPRPEAIATALSEASTDRHEADERARLAREWTRAHHSEQALTESVARLRTELE